MDRIVILINAISEHPTEDELDVLDQAGVVEETLQKLGFITGRVFMGLDLAKARDEIAAFTPKLVFNLVESLAGKANLIYLAPALLESMKLPYTGCRLEGMFLTSNKPLAKKIMTGKGLPTPLSYLTSETDLLKPGTRYIAKPLWEDASVGITDASVFTGYDRSLIQSLQENWGSAFFVEEFIEGREFNVSILANNRYPQVMPLAEILFRDFPGGKPRIVSYAAKWDKNTFEYVNTPRTFDIIDLDDLLKQELVRLCEQCWQVFDLKGYARVDFRLDENNRPYILEINANPCISPDAGFYAACERAGIPFTEVVRRIVADSF